MSELNLLPCPMCGASVTVHHEEGDHYHSIDCECGVSYSGPTPEDCVTAWNRRATQQASAPAERTPIHDQTARWAIDGAILKGRIGKAAPPTTDHWLYEYWRIGQQLAKLGETSAWDNVTPADDAPAAVGAPQGQAELPPALFDGKAVYDEITAKLGKGHCHSPDAVAATLDAVVRMMKREGAQGQAEPVAWAAWHREMGKIHSTSTHFKYLFELYGGKPEFDVRPMVFSDAAPTQPTQPAEREKLQDLFTDTERAGDRIAFALHGLLERGAGASIDAEFVRLYQNAPDEWRQAREALRAVVPQGGIMSGPAERED